MLACIRSRATQCSRHTGKPGAERVHRMVAKLRISHLAQHAASLDIQIVAEAGGVVHRIDVDLSRCEKGQVGVTHLLSHNVLHSGASSSTCLMGKRASLRA